MTTKTQLPEFKGELLLRIPKDTPKADILGRDVPFTDALMQEYSGRVAKDFNNNPALEIFSYNKYMAYNFKGVVEGSTPFAVVLLNQILREEGLRTATQADLEKIIETEALDLRDSYIDSGLVLKSPGFTSNPYLANIIYHQLKEKLNRNFKSPVMIPLAELDLVKNADTHYELGFHLRDNSKTFYAPKLGDSSGGGFYSADINPKTGLPKKISFREGNTEHRSLNNTTQNGLLRMSMEVGPPWGMQDIVIGGQALGYTNSKEEFSKRYEHYKDNWKELTR